ncbi:xanthine dehydrogenase/oxidase [Anabrus simplex]|uniref:xanthine dehydrogenase/oxidase n=1 Tax=Anabrus simplex TaxID=316456 RepID=UPI0035A3C6D3
MEAEAVFTINDKLYRVDSKIPPDTSLNTYIRNYANLRGTKFMCQEGGCGACVVAVTFNHPASKELQTMAVNSCLVPVFSCHGWAITTIEGVGNKKNGYHKIQSRLAQFNGTQCGYCSPGMVMNMFSLASGKKTTMKDVENSFGGNMCRCTGYRPILDAFKSLAVDATPELVKKCQDIEDLTSSVCPATGKPCLDDVFGARTTAVQRLQAGLPSLHLRFKQAQWFRVNTMAEIFKVLKDMGTDNSYMLVGGNTGHGVYRRVEPNVFVDIAGVEELKTYSTTPNLVLGAQMSLTEVMELFYSLSAERPEYKYTKVLADHIDLIANVPVRNVGSLAGNLMLKHQHCEFPSDLFLLLEMVGAKMTVATHEGAITNLTMPEFLQLDMNKKVIHSLSLPSLDESHVVMSYKVMPRAQNAHAYVNAGFMFRMTVQNHGTVLEYPTIVYGGIHPQFIHASKTEKYLAGKQLFSTEVLQCALDILDSEIHPDSVLTDSSPAYRKGLAKGLFYKFVLSLAPPQLNKRFISGGVSMHQTRPLSSGKQEFDTDKSMWPVNQPIPKLEATIQCAGEALYVNDVPTIPGELFAAFVVTKVGQGNIEKIDPSPALSMPGVVSFLGAENIPGENNFAAPLFNMDNKEELFCSGKILYAGQPVGMVLAETQTIANNAAKAVVLKYKGVKKPILTTREAIKTGDATRVVEQSKIEPKDKVTKNAKHVIKGSWEIGSQYHYSMETHSCVCIPTEDGLDVYPATQWMDLTHLAIARALVIPENSINIVVRRLGGAYGCKISRGNQVAVACALAAQTLNRPVRFVMTMEANMEAIGKRYSCAMDYEVGLEDDGRIKYLEADLFEDLGSNLNESFVFLMVEHFKNCYDISKWNVKGNAVRTDIPSNTYCRAPGSLEGVSFIEYIMEHAGRVLKKDPTEIRLANMGKEDNAIPKMIPEIKKWADWERRKRDVDNYNKDNRWMKKGIALLPMKYPFLRLGGFHATVSVYAVDGTIAVSHGAIECGQGANTKVAQVVAHTLGVPLEMVVVKPSNNFTSPNGTVTGGSTASESAAYAAIKCCEELLSRLEPIKKKMEKATWKEWTAEAYKQGVDLCTHYMFKGTELPAAYNIFGVAIAEVQIDLLTGQQMVLRVDILEDAGTSLSPEVDVGQVEGAFIMGLGYWLMEQLIYHPETGELLTTRTWNYKPPGAKDIPVDFRVQLQKNVPNPVGVLRSKATGEPALCLSGTILFAIRHALDSARAEIGNKETWYPISLPASAENVFLTTLPDHKHYVL